MGVGARGVWAALILGALLVLALLKAAVDSPGLGGSLNTQNLVPSGNHSANPTENVTTVTSNHTSQPTSTVRQPTTPQSSASKNETVTATPRITTATGPANRTNTSSVSQNATQTTPATVTSSAHNSSATSASSSVTIRTIQTGSSGRITAVVPRPVVKASALTRTITPTINSKGNPGSKFDIGSFLGGIVLTLGVLSILYIGCRTYYSRRGIRYRTIDEHDAII